MQCRNEGSINYQRKCEWSFPRDWDLRIWGDRWLITGERSLSSTTGNSPT